MSETIFASVANNFQTTLGATYAPGSGAIRLASGSGATLAAKLTAAGFPPVSPSAPLRFTVIAAAVVNRFGQISDTSRLTVFVATDLSDDDLTGVAAVEGTTDQSFSVGDTIAVLWTAGQAQAVQAAVNDVEAALASYVVLGGASGGQTVNGGTGANENLTLVSTAHATKGRVNLGSASSYADAIGGLTLNKVSFANGTSIAGASGATMFNAASLDPSWVFRGTGGNNRLVQIDGTTAQGTLLYVSVNDNQSILRVEKDGQVRAMSRAAGISPFAVEGTTSQTAALQLLRGLSSTGTLREVANIDGGFVVSTDASRTGFISLSAIDFAGTRQGLKVSSDGTQALIGFYGAAPVAKAAAPTTLSDVITILRNLGLCS